MAEGLDSDGDSVLDDEDTNAQAAAANGTQHRGAMIMYWDVSNLFSVAPSDVDIVIQDRKCWIQNSIILMHKQHLEVQTLPSSLRPVLVIFQMLTMITIYRKLLSKRMLSIRTNVPLSQLNPHSILTSCHSIQMELTMQSIE